jgi:CHAT domain-containing protein
VTVAPSATWWASAPPPDDGARRAVVVAGPRLAFAEAEASAVADGYPGAVTLTGPAATAAQVTAALNRAALLHVACHGRIRDDNALWSSLELFDGPLYLYDLDRAARTPPLVVLSGCETGVGVRVGDQLLGLSTALLRRGTRALVAAVCPLPDSAATRDTMIALHRRLAGGDPPSVALAALAGGPSPLVAAALTCFGAG